MENQSGPARDGTGLPAALQPGPPPAALRRSAGQRPAGRPPRCTGCQVCGASLEGTKSRFYKRYHICWTHMAAPAVEVAGELQRFCQQCGRFHLLDDFDGEMRSCRRQLARHAARRRAARAAAAAKLRAATSSPSTSQGAASGGEPAVKPVVCTAPASPLPSDAGAPAVTAAVPIIQATAPTLPQPQPLPRAQASGSNSGSSTCPAGEQRSSHSTGLDTLLAAAEEAAEQQQHVAAEWRVAKKRPLPEVAEHEAQREPKRPASLGPPEEWFAPPQTAGWLALSKPPSPMPYAAVSSSQSQQASLPASLLPPLAPLSLPTLPLPPLAMPALSAPPVAASPPPAVAAVASLGASLQLLQQLPMHPALADLPTHPGWLEAYMAGLASVAAERILLELLAVSRQ